MKRLLSYGFFLMMLFTLPYAYAAEMTDTASTEKEKVKLLFVMRADSATITKTDKGLELTLSKPDSKTLYFSDRPVRKAGFVSTHKLMENWMKSSSSFQSNPPNAAIIYNGANVDKTGSAQAIAVELKNPVALQDGSWKFSLSDLEGKLSVGSHQEVILFIDELGGCTAAIFSLGKFGGC